MARVGWTELPSAVRRAVEARAGDVLSYEPVVGGLTCGTAAILDTVLDGRVFGERFAEPGMWQRWPRRMPRLRSTRWCSPRPPGCCGGWQQSAGMCWASNTCRADMRIYRARRTGFCCPTRWPACTVCRPGRCPAAGRRFAGGPRTGQSDLLAGTALLHTDTNPHNLLVGGDRAWLVDWAMPASGPAWVDLAYTAVRIMEAGEPAAVALNWLSGLPGWQHADGRAIEVFVGAVCRQWSALVGEHKATSSNTRFQALLAGAAARM